MLNYSYLFFKYNLSNLIETNSMESYYNSLMSAKDVMTLKNLVNGQKNATKNKVSRSVFIYH